MIQLYLFGASVLCVGVIWFFVVRPILEGFGWIAPREVSTVSDDTPPEITSSSEPVAPPSARSSLRTDDGRTTDGPKQPTYSRDILLDTYKSLRAHGYTRDEGRTLLRALGVPLSSDLWAKAEPPPPEQPDDDDEDVLITPYAGRRTRSSYYPDAPELEYQAPKN